MATTKKEILKPMVVADPDTGKEYTLEFSRKTVSVTERAGLNITQIESQSMTMIPLMFWGAFQMHHPHMSKEQTDKILFDGLGGLKEDEMAYLGKLYAAPFQTLVANEGESGNPRRMVVKI